MRLVYTEPSRDDIADIYRHNARRSVRAALAVEQRIKAACQRAAEFPKLAPRTVWPDVHRAPMLQHPYTIFYRIRDEQRLIEILRVVYGPRIRNLDELPED